MRHIRRDLSPVGIDLISNGGICDTDFPFADLYRAMRATTPNPTKMLFPF